MLIKARMMAPFNNDTPASAPNSFMYTEVIFSPINPQTTDGIAANSSMTTFRISFSRGPQNSEMKTAPPKLNGTVIIIATIATLNVPRIIRAAP